MSGFCTGAADCGWRGEDCNALPGEARCCVTCTHKRHVDFTTPGFDPKALVPVGPELPDWFDQTHPHTLGKAGSVDTMIYVDTLVRLGWTVVPREQFGVAYAKAYPPGWTEADQVAYQRRSDSTVRPSPFD